MLFLPSLQIHNTDLKQNKPKQVTPLSVINMGSFTSETLFVAAISVLLFQFTSKDKLFIVLTTSFCLLKVV